MGGNPDCRFLPPATKGWRLFHKDHVVVGVAGGQPGEKHIPGKESEREVRDPEQEEPRSSSLKGVGLYKDLQFQGKRGS